MPDSVEAYLKNGGSPSGLGGLWPMAHANPRR